MHSFTGAFICECLFQAESSQHTQPTGLLDNLAGISECFALDEVEAIRAALEERDTDWARAALQQLSLYASPLQFHTRYRMACNADLLPRSVHFSVR